MAVTTPIADIGWRAEPFRLKGVDGRMHSLRELAGPRGTLVMFICNHCPYVKAVIRRIANDAAGRWAVTASDDKTARVWDLAAPPRGGRWR